MMCIPQLRKEETIGMNTIFVFTPISCVGSKNCFFSPSTFLPTSFFYAKTNPCKNYHLVRLLVVRNLEMLFKV
jgi:hypothetical protein